MIQYDEPIPNYFIREGTANDGDTIFCLIEGLIDFNDACDYSTNTREGMSAFKF